MQAKEFLQENTIGPFKVLDFDPVSKKANLKDYGVLQLDFSIKDMPKPGYNYSFELDTNNIAQKITSTVVDIVVHTNDQILLIKRKNPPFQGWWALPGGFVDPHESPIQAAQRELKEETGLTIDNVKFVGKFDKPYRDPRMQHVVSMAYVCFLPNKKLVKGQDDAELAAWIDKNSLVDIDLAFDHRSIIKQALDKEFTNQSFSVNNNTHKSDFAYYYSTRKK